VTGVPEEVRSLAEERERARRDRDFARADALRERIREAGFDVIDTPAGPEVAARTAGSGEGRPDVHARSEDVPSVLDRPARGEPTIQWVVQGWPEDVHRGFRSVVETLSSDFQSVIVDAAGVGSLDWYRGELLHVSPSAGWAVAQNAGLRRAAGDVVIVMDGSIELTGDCVTRLGEALRDPTVGVTGPFGIVTDDLHEFRQSEGPDVDAVEGYLMAFRRELLQRGLRFDEKFKFYRTADIELSFQVKAMGLRATVTPLPLIRHEHRMWTNTSEEERDRLSKRNFYRFLDRWRGRTDLLVSPRNERGG
jgi:Glycosyl transferase family 2